MLRLLNTPGIIEAKFKYGFQTYNVGIEVLKDLHKEPTLISFPMLCTYYFHINYYKKSISIVKNSVGQITGFEFWERCAIGYMKLFIPFGKVKFICHYPKKYYNPQTLKTND